MNCKYILLINHLSSLRGLCNEWTSFTFFSPMKLRQPQASSHNRWIRSPFSLTFIIHDFKLIPMTHYKLVLNLFLFCHYFIFSSQSVQKRIIFNMLSVVFANCKLWIANHVCLLKLSNLESVWTFERVAFDITKHFQNINSSSCI